MKDFDGDELWGALLFENDMADTFDTIHPKEMIMSKNAPEADKRIRLTVPSLISTTAWLSEEEELLEKTGFDFSAIPVVNL